MHLFRKHFDFILSGYQSNRLLSVDILRGLTIFTMILVNNPGSWGHLYAPLRHAEWHGWTMTDLVFPFFLFIVGISISLSFSREKIEQLSLREKQKTIAIRTLKLIGLGWLLGLSYYNFYSPDFNWFNDRLLKIRWFGVLQRIALVYFICASIYILVNKKKQSIASLFGIFVSLIVYWLMMMLVSYQDQTGNSFQGLLVSGNNFAAYVDHGLFGINHLYHKSLLPFSSDPEGLLTTLPALASCFSGILVAEMILTKKDRLEQIRQLLIIGTISLIFAYILSNWIPFNKNLWTPSYVFLSSGIAMQLLGLCIYCVDYKQWRSWFSPFIVFGANAIALYMLSGFVVRIMSMIKINESSLHSVIYEPIKMVGNDPKFHSLLFAVLFMLVMYVPTFWMYKKRIFWKV